MRARLKLRAYIASLVRRPNAGFCSGRSNKLRAQRASENARLQQASLGRHRVDVASKQPVAQRNGDGPPPSRTCNCSIGFGFWRLSSSSRWSNLRLAADCDQHANQRQDHDP